MNIGQLRTALEQFQTETNITDDVEVVIEDDSADIYGIGQVTEIDGRIVISTGDLEEMEDD